MFQQRFRSSTNLPSVRSAAKKDTNGHLFHSLEGESSL